MDPHIHPEIESTIIRVNPDLESNNFFLDNANWKGILRQYRDSR